MFTTLDKAIAAGIMAVVFVLNNFTNFHFGVSEEVANAIASVISPILVYLVPNKA